MSRSVARERSQIGGTRTLFASGFEQNRLVIPEHFLHRANIASTEGSCVSDAESQSGGMRALSL